MISICVVCVFFLFCSISRRETDLHTQMHPCLFAFIVISICVDCVLFVFCSIFRREADAQTQINPFVYLRSL